MWVNVTLPFCTVFVRSLITDAGRSGAAWDPHPLPEGVQALQEGLQDHGELGPRAVHLQVRHIASGQYIICHVRVSGSTRLCWEPGSMRHGASRTWGSWPRCWRTGKSECLLYLASRRFHSPLCQGKLARAALWPFIFKNDPGGIIKDREAVAPDWVFD